MWGKRISLSLNLHHVATATTDEVVGDPVRSNHLVCVQRVSYRDVDNGATRAVYLKRGHGIDFLLSQTLTLTAAYIYDDPYEVYFTEGEQLVIQFIGCSIGDNLVAFVSGYEQSFIETPPSGVAVAVVEAT